MEIKTDDLLTDHRRPIFSCDERKDRTALSSILIAVTVFGIVLAVILWEHHEKSQKTSSIASATHK